MDPDDIIDDMEEQGAAAEELALMAEVDRLIDQVSTLEERCEDLRKDLMDARASATAHARFAADAVSRLNLIRVLLNDPAQTGTPEELLLLVRAALVEGQA